MAPAACRELPAARRRRRRRPLASSAESVARSARRSRSRRRSSARRRPAPSPSPMAAPRSAAVAAVALTGSGNSRTAACSAGGLNMGSHAIVAEYGGETSAAGNQPSTGSMTMTVVNAPGTFALTVVRTGSGTVTRNPAGIDCGDGLPELCQRHQRLADRHAGGRFRIQRVEQRVYRQGCLRGRHDWRQRYNGRICLGRHGQRIRQRMGSESLCRLLWPPGRSGRTGILGGTDGQGRWIAVVDHGRLRHLGRIQPSRMAA